MAISKPPRAFWPLAITAANQHIDFVSGSTYVAHIAVDTYYSPEDLAAAVDVALTAALAGAWTVTVGSTGRITIAYSSAFSLKFSTGANAAASARDVLGFGTVDTASATSATGTLQHQNGWYPERPCTFDSREEYERTSAGTVSLSGKTKLLTFGSVRAQRRVSFAWLPEWKTKIAREGAYTNEALERLWRYGYARFRWWPDATTTVSYGDFVLDPKDLAQFKPGRDERMQLYSYDLRMWAYL